MSKYRVDTAGQFLFKIVFYLRYGYTRYVLCTIPEGKDLNALDEKLLKKYEVTYHRATRANRKKKGLANVIYIRFGHTFILMASEGIHEIFALDKSYHFAEKPLLLYGYSIKYKNGTSSIQLDNKRYQTVRKHSLAIALHNEKKVTDWLKGISPLSFKDVNNQRWKIYKAVNKKRKVAGLKTISWENINRIKKRESIREKSN